MDSLHRPAKACASAGNVCWGIFAIFFLLGASPVRAQSRYFPPGTFAERGKQAQAIVLTWCSRELKALREPSLWSLSRNDKHATVYRFLWLRTFHHPVAIRAITAPDGTAKLITKVTGGTGGYGPGPIIENQTKDLSAAQVKALLQKVSDANFWKLPTEEFSTSIGLDGAQWIVEGVQDGNYHIVDRWSPKKSAYRALCWFFVSKLARLHIPRNEIY